MSGIEDNSILLSNNKGEILVASEKGAKLLDDKRETVIIDKKVLAIGIDNEMLAYESRKGLVIADKNGHIRKNIKTEICPCNAVALRDGGYYILEKRIREICLLQSGICRMNMSYQERQMD